MHSISQYTDQSHMEKTDTMTSQNVYLTGIVVTLLALGSLPQAVVATAAETDTAQNRPPNIIFILADDLGYGDLGCYGQTRIQTPNIDRLASGGMRFTSYYAGSTVCAPSRSCLMTGQHTGHTRVRGNSPRLPLEPGDVTVAEVLKEAGYATGIVGKWGLGEPATSGIPNRQGFDHWFGYLNQGRAHNYYPDYLWQNREKFSLEGNTGGKKEQYTHDLFQRQALSFVERHRDRPFFLYLAVTIPHANNELGRETGNGMEVPGDEPYSDRDWPQPQKNHAAMITRLDRTVGRLMERIKQLGIDEQTIVFFTSDNGPHAEGGAHPDFFNSSGPLRGWKRDLYEGGIRVPLLVRWLGHITPGATNDEPFAFWDFLPTAAALAGTETPAGLDGISMLPALSGSSGVADTSRDEAARFLYWEFHERGYQQAVRHGKWKAVRKAAGAPLELFDLSRDIGEETDIAADHTDVVARIEDYLKTARSESDHWPRKQRSRGG